MCRSLSRRGSPRRRVPAQQVSSCAFSDAPAVLNGRLGQRGSGRDERARPLPFSRRLHRRAHVGWSVAWAGENSRGLLRRRRERGMHDTRGSPPGAVRLRGWLRGAALSHGPAQARLSGLSPAHRLGVCGGHTLAEGARSNSLAGLEKSSVAHTRVSSSASREGGCRDATRGPRDQARPPALRQAAEGLAGPAVDPPWAKATGHGGSSRKTGTSG